MFDDDNELAIVLFCFVAAVSNSFTLFTSNVETAAVATSLMFVFIILDQIIHGINVNFICWWMFLLKALFHFVVSF